MPPKTQTFNLVCPFCKRKSAQHKALIEHIQKNHLEHLYGHMLGLGDDEVKEFLNNKLLLTCDVCRPKGPFTYDICMINSLLLPRLMEYYYLPYYILW